MTATRLPVRSTEWSQRDEWKSVALEGLDALDVGQLGLGQPAGAEDQGAWR